jgi:GT2 family glycosyltransferase
MELTACVTTRNAIQDLDACLRALWDSSKKPFAVIVSDDSNDKDIQRENRRIVEQYPDTTYILGPQRGLCANRNCAVNAALDTEFVYFVDDDVCVATDFIANALARYAQMPLEERSHTFLTGGSIYKLTFRGYYALSHFPQCVNIHTAIFPRSFFNEEQWDELIFFGPEEGELSLRALKRGYKIVYCPELNIINTRPGKSTFQVGAYGDITDYDLYVEAGRLYVGIKRYKILQPNSLKLIAFIFIYFTHMSVYLFKKKALNALFEIIRRSHIQKLWQMS